MLNKMRQQISNYGMIQKGDKVICAVSGGADSMALLWAMYLLKDKLEITLEAVHFNHGLRAEESDRDEVFVRDFCNGYGITCHVGRKTVTSGKKGLEAAARNARYDYFGTLSGKIATAHTADDNVETVLMHLVRGTGLKGLGGIMPVNANVIRPLLSVTRDDVLAFLEEYHIPYVQDSSNATDDFLRNRLRHHVMPMLKEENPRLAQSVSAMAMELRQDEQALQTLVPNMDCLQVSQLRQMEPSLRRRAVSNFLCKCGVLEPERNHVTLAEKLIFSERPSAYADFPGNIRICRCYDQLIAVDKQQPFTTTQLQVGETVLLAQLGIRVSCRQCNEPSNQTNCFTVSPVGQVILRPRQAGDKIRLPGGTKSLKKLFIDRKIPEHMRSSIVVVADQQGVLGVFGIGPNMERLTDHGVQICFEEI